MISRLWHWMLEHIWLTIGIVVGLFVFWRIWRGSSGGSAAVNASQPGVDPTVVQAGLQQQEIQAQLQATAANNQNQLAQQQEADASNLAIAQVAAQLQQYQTDAAAKVAGEQISAQTQSDTLQAAIAAQSLQVQEQVAAMQSQTQQLAIQQSTQVAALGAQVSEVAAQSQAQTAQAVIAQQVQIAQINAGRDVGIAKANRRWCMLTNACCEVLKLPDDCFELTMLRKLRDEYVVHLPDGPKRISDYYDLAPRLIAGINAQPNARYLWQRIRQEHILPAARAVHAGNNEGAVQLYYQMLATLARYIAPAPDSP